MWILGNRVVRITLLLKFEDIIKKGRSVFTCPSEGIEMERDKNYFNTMCPLIYFNERSVLGQFTLSLL
jgi:hypothetical protein